MVVDYLRSCYTTQARLFSGSPGRHSTIRWYWAAPGALRLPIPTVFTSNNWIDASERPGTDLGEVHGATRTWNNGRIDHRPPGTHYHGDPYFFETGSPTGNLLRRLPSGIPIECIEAVAPAGGMVIGGEALVWSIADEVPSELCPGVSIPPILVNRYVIFPPHTVPFSDRDAAYYDATVGVESWVLRIRGGFSTVLDCNIPAGKLFFKEAGGAVTGHTEMDPPATGDPSFSNQDVDLAFENCSPWFIQMRVNFVRDDTSAALNIVVRWVFPPG